jgi:hypothetical protein
LQRRMAGETNIKNYTASDIERYHQGLLSSKERHDLEKAALDDPFLADALEGYSFAGINAAADIKDLRNRLQEKTEGAKLVPLATSSRSQFPWFRAAVAIILIVGAGLLVYQLTIPKRNNDLAAIEKTGKKEPPVTETKQPVQSNKTDTVTGIDQLQPAAGTTTNTATNTGKNIEKKKLNPEKVIIARDTKVNDEKPTIVTGRNETVATREKEINALKTDTVFAIMAEDALAKQEKDKTVPSPTYRNVQTPSGMENTETANRKLANSRRNDDNFRSNIFRGRVTDAENNGLPFANVTNMDDNVGTYADARGYFNLISPDSVLNVQVKSIGFNNNSYLLRNNIPTNQVVLEEDKTLNEVVISNKKPNAVARNRNLSSNMKLEEPEPADGWDNYDTYIANNLNIPEEYKSKPTGEAEVEISFEVDKNGEPVNIRVEKSLCKKCDKEAIRLVKQGPKWIRNAPKGRTTIKVPFSSLSQ